MTGSLLLADGASHADLATYVQRARRVDVDGTVRLVAGGDAVAVYVSPVHGGGGPTVLGLLVLRLAAPVDVDTTVALAALADRLARPVGDAGSPVELSLPPVPATGSAWAGVSPPRSGWEAVGAVPQQVLREAARAGIAEVAGAVGEGAAGPVVSRLRALVWGRELPGVPGVPAGVAFAADALGFVVPEEPVALFAAGPWRRLSTARGHVLARHSLI